MMDDKASVELILKIQVPHMGIVKTLRTNTGLKVGTITEAILEKLETAEKQDFSHFGLYMYGETGPLWLSDNSYIRSYGLKSGDTLQFKLKPVLGAPQPQPAQPTQVPLARKLSAPFLSSARLRTSSTPVSPQISLPSIPSSPSMSSPKSPREGRKSTAKEALLKIFGSDNKQAATNVPPTSHPHQHRPISVSTPIPPSPSLLATQTPAVAPPPPPSESSQMHKSPSAPSPTQHRAHSATAPPKPVSKLSVSVNLPPSHPPSNPADDNISPRQLSPLQPHTPQQRAPPSPMQPPPTLARAPSFSNPPLPRVPSNLPPLYRGPNGDAATTPRDGSQTPRAHACSCELNKQQTCAHKEELERTAAQARKLAQRIELTECILTDTLQAIDEGEGDMQAIKMYLRTALASLKREDVAQISFGKD